ncbi:MAG: B12-binding domain-containing radical SAM protein [Betaproteobacteria bacterium]
MSIANIGQDVLLVYPGKYKAPDPQIPLALLHIAASLQQEGFMVRIIDMRLQNYHSFSIGKPLFVGITCMSGQQIKYALEFAQYTRTQTSCPLVWGGVHPTLLPEQTAKNNLVDIVVRGEGELIIKDLAHALAENRPLDSIKGIIYRSNGTIKSNPDGQTIELDAIPIDLPYDLIQMERYPSFKAGRFHFQTSRGCPHKCGFCYNSSFNKTHWRGKSAKRVLDEIQYIKTKFSHIKMLDPIDDNVFVDQSRIRQICEGLIERRLNLQWRANCRFDYVAAYDKEFLELLEKAGCVELCFGGESGSERLQQLICKDVTAQEMLQSVEKLRQWAPSIEPFISWMSGLPDETDANLVETFDLMDRLQKINPKTQHYNVFIYTPFPSPIMKYLPSEFAPPQSLEEWGNINVFHYNPPWHTRAHRAKLHAISAVVHYAFNSKARISEHNLAYKVGYLIMNKIAKYRWEHRYFDFPVELELVDALSRWLKGFV